MYIKKRFLQKHLQESDSKKCVCMWSNCAKVFLDSEKNKGKGISTLESEITKPIKNIGKLCKLLNLKEDLRI